MYISFKWSERKPLSPRINMGWVIIKKKQTREKAHNYSSNIFWWHLLKTSRWIFSDGTRCLDSKQKFGLRVPGRTALSPIWTQPKFIDWTTTTGSSEAPILSECICNSYQRAVLVGPNTGQPPRNNKGRLVLVVAFFSTHVWWQQRTCLPCRQWGWRGWMYVILRFN